MIRKKLCVVEDSDLKTALKKLDEGGYGVLFVLNSREQMVGLLTDGDVRKALLRGIELSAPLSQAMNTKFTFGNSTQSRESHIALLKKIKRRHLPILDGDKKLVDIVLLDDVDFALVDTPVVLMVGGAGTRLGSLTVDTPKPMLKVGEKPMLELILENFLETGFSRFHFCVNYKSQVIENHFSDGARWGANISYIREEKPLGTAGGLSLLKDQIKQSFILMNGDLLTNVKLGKLLEYHREHKGVATVAVRKNTFEVPFGVVEYKNSYINKIVEKPTMEFFVSAGIYALEPKCLEYVPENTPFDMPHLLAEILNKGEKIAAFPMHEYWKDIGRPDDFEQAVDDQKKIFS